MGAMVAAPSPAVNVAGRAGEAPSSFDPEPGPERRAAVCAKHARRDI